MTADYTIEATPGQVAAIERDGFLVVAGQTCPTCQGSRNVGEPGYTYMGIPEPGSYEACPDCMDDHGIPEGTVPTTKPCPECGGDGVSARHCSVCGCGPTRHLAMVCLSCSRDCLGEKATMTDTCPTCDGDGTVPIVVEVVVPERAEVQSAWVDIYPARTLLRGTAEAVPVVDDPDDLPGEPPVLTLRMGRAIYWPEGESGPDGLIDVSHFADVPRPEVGDTAWIIRGEGS